MSKEIKKRDGFFKSYHKYNNNKSYNKRKEDLEKENIELEKGVVITPYFLEKN